MTALAQELSKWIAPRLIRDGLIDRHAHAADAGFYFLLPQLVVFPETEQDICQLFSFSHTHKVPLTFRAAGTSLSGQSITDGILVCIGRSFKKMEPIDNGRYVRVEPGVIGAHVNHTLKKYGTKIGPDPASIGAAMLGGMLSNNSSGMCCGVAHNAYHTLQSMTLILTNGHRYNTAEQADYARFEEQEPALFNGIQACRKRLMAENNLVELIRKKYRIKNTVGYGINALLDYEHPLDILSRLMIGAEGTLGFISEAVLLTLPDKPAKKTGLLFFESPVAAATAIPALQSTGAEALEFMDRAALRSIENLPDCPPAIAGLPNQATAILCEYQAADTASLENLFTAATAVLQSLPLLTTPIFTEQPEEQAQLWKLRKGLYPAVAAVRAKGTTALLEDVAVPVEQLGEAVIDLQQLFQRFGYHNAILFGHAKEGNLHFLITQSVNDAASVAVFDAFNRELANIIVHKYGGSLKAEHGTGRQIAPFVREEWGEAIYSIMCELKTLCDPHQLLNPGVVINADPTCHLKHLKTNPIVEEEVDRCVECGYCENRCPSKNYTMTPRQRIQVRRALQRLEQAGDQVAVRELSHAYQFSGMDTCAVDGMCAVDCPVTINTGDLIKRLRYEQQSPMARRLSLWLANHFGLFAGTVQWVLRCGHLINRIFGKQTLYKTTSLIRKGIASFPLYMRQMSKPVTIRSVVPAEYDVVYFPTCITRWMGGDMNESSHSVDVLKQLCERAGIRLCIPEQAQGNCCGQLFSSKGLYDAYRIKINSTIKDCWEWSKEGKVPIVLDVTSCTQSIRQARPYLDAENQQRFDRLKFIDSIELAADWLLPRLQVTRPKQHIALHPVCSVHKLGLTNQLKSIAQTCSKEYTLPFHASCCGMAGDRGFYYPELTAAATKAELDELAANTYDGCYSSGKTCEMALSENSGYDFRSLLYLIRDVTEPQPH
ncbi:MAG: FAD-binding and (Fe-S)-binding domain-containing protein [Bacteroidota bacterium]